jgi:hypothetical protein
MIRFAPNSGVRQRTRAMEQRYRKIMGSPTALQEVISWGSLMAAHFYTWKRRLFPWTPKTEGFRRYRYHPAAASPGTAPYEIDRAASFDFRFTLKRLVPTGLTLIRRCLQQTGFSKKPL